MSFEELDACRAPRQPDVSSAARGWFAALSMALAMSACGASVPIALRGRLAGELGSARAPTLVRAGAEIRLVYETQTGRRARAWTAGAFAEERSSEEDGPLFTGRLELDEVALAARGSSPRLANGLLLRGGAVLGWAPSIAVSRSGTTHLAFDRSSENDYDVVYRDAGGRETVVAGTRAFEAHASLCVDARERVWLAWDEGDADWGRGESLHLARRVRLAVWSDGRWCDAPSALPESLLAPDRSAGAADAVLAELPRLVADERGPIWLFCRVMQRWKGPEGRGSFRQVAWQIRALALTEDGWSEPFTLPGSDGPNHDTLAVVALPQGGVLAAYESDDRARAFSPSVRWEDPIGTDTFVRAAELHADGGLPTLGPERAVGRTDPPSPPLPEDPDPSLVSAGCVRLWGDLHRHSDLSRCKMDIDGSAVDQFRYAIDVGRLDFLALTDHFQHLTPAAWDFARETSARFALDGRFSPLYGFERALEGGHRNLLCIDARAAERAPFVPFRPEAPWRGFDDGRWIAIPHQVADRQALLDWSQPAPEIEREVEIYQSRRGSYEASDAPRRSLSADPAAPFVVDYLTQGRRFGVIASSDHETTGRAFAAVLARDRTREALFEALLARRCYAATTKIALDVRLGARLMGESGAVAPDAALAVRAAAGEAIANVVVVRNGKIARTWAGPAGGDPLVSLRVEHLPGTCAVRLALEDAEVDQVRGLALERDDLLEQKEGALVLASVARNRLDEDGVTAVLHAGPQAALRLSINGEERRFVVSELVTKPVPPFAVQGAWVDLRIGAPALGIDRFSGDWQPGDWKSGDWCYVRLERVDGELAWSSPIWVE